MTAAQKVEAAITRGRATLDQLEEHAREMRPDYVRLAAVGPDGSAPDQCLARTAAEHLVLLVDVMQMIRAGEVSLGQMELAEARSGVDDDGHE